MNIQSTRAAPLANVLLGMVLLLSAGAANAVEYWLCAKRGSVTMPGSPAVVVPIWGYVLDTANFTGNCAAPVALPGPALTVPAADTTLTVHLKNLLLFEPTSIVIPGQTATMAPVKFTDAQGRQRVRSFTHEAPAAGGMADYTWNNIRPGTYLYHSGTHPQVQVQMGLYGALTKDFTDAVAAVPPAPAVAAQAYDGVPYATAASLLFSELDPAQHAAIDGGTYGLATTPTACNDTDGTPLPMTSTLCYKPKYFLINGKPYQAGDAPLAALQTGQATLLRFLNAGLRAYVPLIQGTHMKMIAEDGNRYQYRDLSGPSPVTLPRDQFQYSTWLAALKTTDVIVTPTAAGSFPIYDRRLNTVSGNAQDGGIFGVLQVAAAPQANLGITKTDGVANVAPGGSVTYTIVVSNAGPTAVTGAGVTDLLPAALGAATWTCVAGAGSACGAASGSGNLATTVNLASGGSATFSVTGTVAAGASGTLVNTATVAPPAGVVDPNPANNSATDTDTIGAAATVQAYFSTAGNTAVPGVAGTPDDADIYAWYSDGSYARVFDASAAGVPGGANVDAFVYRSASEIYLSFSNNGGVTLPGLANVQDEDIVRWNGTAWSLYFDGSDVGLSSADSEDVDAFALLPDGSLLVSTTGAGAVAGVTGVASHDLLRCAPGTFGAATTCAPWSLYFDGSDIGLTTGGENLRFVKVVTGTEIQIGTSFSSATSFAVASGANSLAGTGNQVFACTAPTTGPATACGGFRVVLTLPTISGSTIDAIYLP